MSNDFSTSAMLFDTSRSKHDYSPNHTTTFLTGALVPFYADSDILPNTTVKIDVSGVIRGLTPIAPVMDNAFFDLYWFYVPHKQTMSRQMMSPQTGDAERSWKAFIGAQDYLIGMPFPTADQCIPLIAFGADQLYSGSGDTPFHPQSLADYLGCPRDSNTYNSSTGAYRYIPALEPLCYYQIWDTNFRDPNTMSPVTWGFTSGNIPSGPDQGQKMVSLSGTFTHWLDTYTNNPTYNALTTTTTGLLTIGTEWSIMSVCPYHGYFGSCTPWPLRNATSINLPLGQTAPVVTSSNFNSGQTIPLRWGAVGDSTTLATSRPLFGVTTAVTGAPNGRVLTTAGSTSTALGTGTEANLYPLNLAADLSHATAASINSLRDAFALQRWYEMLNRVGNNSYAALKRVSFGAASASEILDDEPLFLGGFRIPIDQTQVANTTGTDIGKTGAYSLTGFNPSTANTGFVQTFTDWGTVMCVGCVRIQDTFDQGMPKKFLRRTRMDHFWKQFANVGNQPVYTSQIYWNKTTVDSKSVFGYMEYGDSYRFKQNMVTGYARPTALQASWNYANNFSSAPSLAGFLDARRQIVNVDRNLVDTSLATGFQWMAQLNFDVTQVMPMPLYSIPGLVDHN